MTKQAANEVSFQIDRDDAGLIALIVDRAIRAGYAKAEEGLGVSMDLITLNGNGCPMDFQRMLDADDFSFAHDFFGIARHLDRSTGELTGFFLPRFARPERRPGWAAAQAMKATASGKQF